jgi:hypothetical protein
MSMAIELFIYLCDIELVGRNEGNAICLIRFKREISEND